ncbi:hypothetical protein, partial [Streptomyces sp. NPDC050264]|uniref:hypothetical protein n=1 Tax=Streptomyces sp. NPDC050264 TaxID=3155038 RepID=UPI00343C7AE5
SGFAPVLAPQALEGLGLLASGTGDLSSGFAPVLAPQALEGLGLLASGTGDLPRGRGRPGFRHEERPL